MGVDYSAVFGIGVEINISELEKLNEKNNWSEEDHFTEIMEELPNFPEELSWGEAGSDSYGGSPSLFIFIEDPFEDTETYDEGVELMYKRVQILQKYINKIGFTNTKVGIVGDLHIW